MWREELVCRKWLNINEEFAHNTKITNTNITELKILDAGTEK
jgi:hypothetical protein